jgi:hypothetical protein
MAKSRDEYAPTQFGGIIFGPHKPAGPEGDPPRIEWNAEREKKP